MTVGPTLRVCYFAAFGVMELSDPMGPCEGELVRCHLIPKQLLKRVGANPMAEGSFVWGCGGVSGTGGHHGQFDFTRTLRLPRAALPEATEQLARDLGLTWFLDRTYGVREEVPSGGDR